MGVPVVAVGEAVGVGVARAPALLAHPAEAVQSGVRVARVEGRVVRPGGSCPGLSSLLGLRAG
jgi:hypothetical protein